MSGGARSLIHELLRYAIIDSHPQNREAHMCFVAIVLASNEHSWEANLDHGLNRGRMNRNHPKNIRFHHVHVYEKKQY